MQWLNGVFHDLRERLLTFETVQGLYFMVFGVALLWRPHLVLTVGGVLLILEGLRRFVVNRTKEAVVQENKVKRRKGRTVTPIVLLAMVPGMAAGQCSTSKVGYTLIQHVEGYVPVCYNDAAGLATIGFGHLVGADEHAELCDGRVLTPEDGFDLLRADVAVHEAEVNMVVQGGLSWHQCDALVSWTFNVGGSALRHSTLLRRVNAGRHGDVPLEMKRWVYAGGRKLRGLVVRRALEGRLYALGVFD